LPHLKKLSRRKSARKRKKHKSNTSVNKPNGLRRSKNSLKMPRKSR